MFEAGLQQIAPDTSPRLEHFLHPSVDATSAAPMDTPDRVSAPAIPMGIITVWFGAYVVDKGFVSFSVWLEIESVDRDGGEC